MIFKNRTRTTLANPSPAKIKAIVEFAREKGVRIFNKDTEKCPSILVVWRDFAGVQGHYGEIEDALPFEDWIAEIAAYQDEGVEIELGCYPATVYKDKVVVAGDVITEEQMEALVAAWRSFSRESVNIV